MQESTIPLITAITILGIITLLFFANEFFRKYKVVKKRKPRKKPTLKNPSKGKTKLLIFKGYTRFEEAITVYQNSGWEPVGDRHIQNNVFSILMKHK